LNDQLPGWPLKIQPLGYGPLAAKYREMRNARLQRPLFDLKGSPPACQER
jgi:hypothetical protein